VQALAATLIGPVPGWSGWQQAAPKISRRQKAKTLRQPLSTSTKVLPSRAGDGDT
jgi:hypothetical protein